MPAPSFLKIRYIILLIISTSLIANAYEVEDGKQQGFTVTADNFVYITSPNKEVFEVTERPFTGPNYSIPPVEPILCTWDPSHTWLGIFITVKRITEIHLFNLRTKTLLKGDPRTPKYPAWFGEKQWFAHTKPIKWSENKLFVDTYVKFRNGGEGHLPEIIVIHDSSFQMIASGKN